MTAAPVSHTGTDGTAAGDGSAAVSPASASPSTAGGVSTQPPGAVPDLPSTPLWSCTWYTQGSFVSGPCTSPVASVEDLPGTILQQVAIDPQAVTTQEALDTLVWSTCFRSVATGTTVVDGLDVSWSRADGQFTTRIDSGGWNKLWTLVVPIGSFQATLRTGALVCFR